MNTKRIIGVDCIRVVAMLSIIIHHCTINDLGLYDILCGTKIVSIKAASCLIAINSIAISGVNLFFLVSGFCRIRIKFSKTISYLLKIYLIVVLVYTMGYIAGLVAFDNDTISFLINPLDRYWYLIVYLFIMLFSPFLNDIINSLTKNKFYYFILLTYFVYCIYGFWFDTNLHVNRGYSFLMATALYIIGGGIKEVGIKKRKWFGLILLIIVACNIITNIMIYLFKGGVCTWEYFAYNNPFVLSQSILIVLMFKDIRIKEWTERRIAFLAKGTLSTYLLHSTCWMASILRPIPVEYVVSRYGMRGGIIFLPIYALCIYVACSFIDFCYEKIKSFLCRTCNVFL